MLNLPIHWSHYPDPAAPALAAFGQGPHGRGGPTRHDVEPDGRRLVAQHALTAAEADKQVVSASDSRCAHRRSRGMAPINPFLTYSDLRMRIDI
jgi:hypothetical protein